ncbi:hypothetical protein GCM10023258_10120 [Terrabacter aeriphilus]|uniref:HTH luxR-type domain-containing protein n=1 Tax=Terrabacter aeriphilus TaxID=515662 RepID=A0ABP9J704_9MICO
MSSDGYVYEIELATRLTARLSACVEADTMPGLLRECAAVLSDFIGADEVLFTQLDLTDPAASTVAAGPGLFRDEGLSADLAQTGSAHPAVLSYLTPGDDRRPRRVSDVATRAAWRRHFDQTCEFRARGAAHQLSIVSTLTPTRGRGWILTRKRRDFTDAEVAVAALLLPALSVLDQACAWGWPGDAPPGTLVPHAEPVPVLPIRAMAAVEREDVRATVHRRGGGGSAACLDPCPSLTQRQLELLRLLADGLSARRMARELRISERTVNKHLELLYRRLDAHDRVNAILTAQRHGLLRL